jgi:DNA mismatch repair protein MutL
LLEADHAVDFRLTAPPVFPSPGILHFAPETVALEQNHGAAWTGDATVSGGGTAALASNGQPGVDDRSGSPIPAPPALANSTRAASCSSAGEEQETELGESPSLHGLASLRPLGQLRESFILAVNQEGLWIIDQHVAHERVLFERVLRERRVEQAQRQRLLMPMLLDLLPAQMVTFAGIAEELEKNGFEVEPFGPRTIAIKAAPAGLEGRALERMLVEVLEQAGSPEQAENLEAARTRIAASIACHAAIKVNTPLDPTRMEWLLAELARTEHPTSCPHGRPIVLRYAWKDIQRAFHRI